MFALNGFRSYIPQVFRLASPNTLTSYPSSNLSAFFPNIQNSTSKNSLRPVHVLGRNSLINSVSVRHFSIKKVETDKAPKAIPYSQAVIRKPFMFLSGQLPLDPKTNKVTVFTIEEQTRLVFDHIAAILKTKNLNFGHILRVDMYIKNKEHFKIVNDIYLEKFTGPIKPARQTLIADFVADGALVEITVIAAIK